MQPWLSMILGDAQTCKAVGKVQPTRILTLPKIGLERGVRYPVADGCGTGKRKSALAA
ncbi:MAG: hypothetical protein ACLUI3_10385 [Christensenellales bacterium]